MENMIFDTAEHLFSDFAEAGFEAMPVHAEDGATEWMPDLWTQIEELGLPTTLLSEDQGGYGLPPSCGLGLVRLAASHAIPAPLGETLVANWLLAAAGLPLADGPATLACGPQITAQRLQGTADRIAWGRHAQTVVVLSVDSIARVHRGRVSEQGFNLAAEPRDTLTWDCEAETAAAPVSEITFRAIGAVLRAQALAGTLEAAVTLTVEYANERQQFGRPIGKFQANQQPLAIAASQTAAARAGADMATDLLPLALTAPDRFITAAAAAKQRAGEAAGMVAGIVHQVHGAIGFTQEYRLQALTRRLWAWRDEWGNEAEWADHLGARVASLEPNGFWPFLTWTGDAA